MISCSIYIIPLDIFTVVLPDRESANKRRKEAIIMGTNGEATKLISRDFADFSMDVFKTKTALHSAN